MITVTIQTEERMAAITALAIATRELAKALNVTPEIHLLENHVSHCDTGILVDTAQKVTRTEILQTDKEKP